MKKYTEGTMKHLEKSEGAEFNWNYEFSFEKIKNDEGRRIIAGFASDDSVDGDNEIMDMESLKSAASDYFKNPIVRFMHDRSFFKGAIGKAIPEYTDSSGRTFKTSFGKVPFIVAEISKSTAIDPIWKMIDEGLYKGFSIGGKAHKKEKSYSKAAQKYVDKIFVKSWIETSVVDTPAANGAFFTVLKSQGATDEHTNDVTPNNKKFNTNYMRNEIEMFNKAVDKFKRGN